MAWHLILIKVPGNCEILRMGSDVWCFPTSDGQIVQVFFQIQAQAQWESRFERPNFEHKLLPGSWSGDLVWTHKGRPFQGLLVIFIWGSTGLGCFITQSQFSREEEAAWQAHGHGVGVFQLKKGIFEYWICVLVVPLSMVPSPCKQ